MTDVVLGLTAVVVAVSEDVPRILVVRHRPHGLARPDAAATPAPHRDALPFGPFDPEHHRTLDRGLRRWVEEQTGLNLRYVEQLYTFGDRYRDPRELSGGPRVVTVGYLALVREAPPTGSGEAEWRDWYEYFPWEDWRESRPDLLDRVIVPALQRWVERAPDAAARAQRRERFLTAFGSGEADWQPERVLDRYELMYQAGLVVEAKRDRDLLLEAGVPPSAIATDAAELPRALGRPMALDNRRILATALGRLRGKLKYRPIVFELLAPTFTLFRLQQVVEALSGVRLHKQNFRRLVLNGGLVEPTGQLESRTGGRPAELYRYRREVVRERSPAGHSGSQP